MKAVDAVPLFGSLFYYAAAEIMAVDCLIWAMMAVATIVVSGLSFFFSSAVMDLAQEEADADAVVVVEIISANLVIQTKKWRYSRHFLF